MIDKEGAKMSQVSDNDDPKIYEEKNLQLGLHVDTGRGAGQGHAIVKAGHREFGSTELEALRHCGKWTKMMYGKKDQNDASCLTTKKTNNRELKTEHFNRIRTSDAKGKEKAKGVHFC